MLRIDGLRWPNVYRDGICRFELVLVTAVVRYAFHASARKVVNVSSAMIFSNLVRQMAYLVRPTIKLKKGIRSGYDSKIRNQPVCPHTS